MSNQYIHINKKKYAVGLFWQPVASGFTPRNYARNLSRTVDRKLNLYTELHGIIGVGSYSYGQFSGMPVAAAEVMNGLAEYPSFLAAFKVDNGFYIVAVRNGVILQDKLFATESDARNEFQNLTELPDWAALVAPDSWDIPHAVDRNIAKTVSVVPHVLLRAVSRFRSSLWPLIALLAFLACVFVFFREPLKEIRSSGNKGKIDPELAAEYKRQIEEKNKELDAQYNIIKTEVKPLVLPYDNLPDVQARAQLCYKAMDFVMQPIPGWNQVSVECDEQNVVATIKRDYGTLGDFYYIASEKMPNAFVREQNEDTLIVSAKLPQLPTFASLDERDAESILRDVTTMFQMQDMAIESDIVVDTITNSVDSAVINVVEVAAQSKLIPTEFMQIFNNFNGVYMTRCAWNVINRTWNYEVIIYAK